MISFQIPSGSLLFMNLLLAVGTGIILKLITRSQPNIGDTYTGKTIISLCVRASVALGVEWILGLLYYLTPTTTIIQYAFAIVVSLHGFWILISTLTLKEVREKLDEIFEKRNDDRRITYDAETREENTEPKAARITEETGARELADANRDGEIGQMEGLEISRQNNDEAELSDDGMIELENVRDKLHILKHGREGHLDGAISGATGEAEVLENK